MSQQPQALIEFQPGLPGTNDPPPYRASGALPDWVRNMPPTVQTPQEPISTVKVCLPFVDAMTAGYIIPLRSTVQFFHREPGKLEFKHPHFAEHGEGVTVQNPDGFRGSPFDQHLVVKFVNHWIIRTPPGYSTLLVPLLNQFTVPFQVLAGLVDTDSYHREIFFPAVCLMPPGTSFEFPRGAPLVQAIPVKRNVWESRISEMPQPEREAIEARVRENPHHYRDDNWSKKEYR